MIVCACARSASSSTFCAPGASTRLIIPCGVVGSLRQGEQFLPDASVRRFVQDKRFGAYAPPSTGRYFIVWGWMQKSVKGYRLGGHIAVFSEWEGLWEIWLTMQSAHDDLPVNGQANRQKGFDPPLSLDRSTTRNMGLHPSDSTECILLPVFNVLREESDV